MMIAEARSLFDYNAWANARVFETVGRLPVEAQLQTVVSSFPSVLDTLAHIVGAEWIWSKRWMGESPDRFPDWVAQPECGDLRQRLAAVEAERADLLGAMQDADLERIVRYGTLSGQQFADPLGQLMRHVVNHSTYHRGQIATQLRQLGRTPPGTDYILWLRAGR